MQIRYVTPGPSGGVVAFFEGGTMTISTTTFTDDVTPAGGVPLVGDPTLPGASACGANAVLQVLSDFTMDYCPAAHPTDMDANGDIRFDSRYVGGLQHAGINDIPGQPTGSTAITVHVDKGPACTVQPQNQAVCAGASATFTATVVGPAAPFNRETAPFSITWTGPNGHTATCSNLPDGGTCPITIQNAQAADAGTYTATVRDAHGCTSTCTGVLVVNPNPICTISPATATTCVGGWQNYTVSISSGTGPFTVGLSGCINETITGVTGSVTRSHACTAPGTCTLTANVTDANGCVSAPCTATHICVPNPSCVISPAAAQNCVGESTNFTVTISSGTGPFTVVLSGCINETITGVVGSVTRSHACAAPGTCTLTANVTDANGCVSTPCTATHTCIACQPECTIEKLVACFLPGNACGTFAKEATGVRDDSCPAFCYQFKVNNTSATVTITDLTVIDKVVAGDGSGQGNPPLRGYDKRSDGYLLQRVCEE